MILTLSRVRLMGPMRQFASATDTSYLTDRWSILVDDKQAAMLAECNIHLARRKYHGLHWLAAHGEPRVYDDVANPWSDKFGPLVEGDVILNIKSPDMDGRTRAVALAVRVLSRPTWEEHADHLAKMT